jgi:hypothetical protein
MPRHGRNSNRPWSQVTLRATIIKTVPNDPRIDPGARQVHGVGLPVGGALYGLFALTAAIEPSSRPLKRAAPSRALDESV